MSTQENQLLELISEIILQYLRHHDTIYAKPTRESE